MTKLGGSAPMPPAIMQAYANSRTPNGSAGADLHVLYAKPGSGAGFAVRAACHAAGNHLFHVDSHGLINIAQSDDPHYYQSVRCALVELLTCAQANNAVYNGFIMH